MSSFLRLRVPSAAFASGALFALGLLVAEMTNPSKIFGFLDVFGDWDPSLMVVMVGAIAVNAPLTWWIRQQRAPLLQPNFAIPVSSAPWRSQLDLRLMVGAALFGVGWGLAGYCPGPALVTLPYALSSNAESAGAWFTAAMVMGMILFAIYDRYRGQKVKPIGQQCCEVRTSRGTLPIVDDVQSSVSR